MADKTNALRILDAAGIPYALLAYDYHLDDLSVERIAAINGLLLAQIFKTLVLKGDNDKVIVAVIPGDRQLNMKALARSAGVKKVTLVEAAQLPVLTGYIRGGCSPVGMRKPFQVFIDRTAMMWDGIYVNAGARGLLMKIAPFDLRMVCNAVFDAIT